MTESGSNRFNERRRGGSYKNSSSGYHPYRPRGGNSANHNPHNRRFSSSSSASSSLSHHRILSIDEALKTDRILSIENFSSIERIKDQDEVPFEYSNYVKKHQKAYLRNIFNNHKKEKWIINLINNSENVENPDINHNSSKWLCSNWTLDNNLEYRDELNWKIDESSNEMNFLTGCETRLYELTESSESLLPNSFSKFVSEYISQIITISNIPPHVDKESLESYLKELAPESETQITFPNAEKSFYRLAWLKLSDPSKIPELVPKLESLGSIEGSKVYFGISSSNFRRFKATNYCEGSEEELYKLSVNLIKLFEPDFDESFFKNDGIETFPQLLDKSVIYLRNVHKFCFYCVSKFGCSQEILRKCGDLHLRKPSENDSVKHDQHRLTEKLSALIGFMEKLSENSKDLDVNLDEILSESSIKKVEEGKFRCNHCSKAFKGPEFVLKHLSLKHEDVFKQAQEDIDNFNKLLANAKLWLFPASMIPRYTKIRSKFSNIYGSSNDDSHGSSKSSISKTSSRRSQEYMDWDASVNNNNTAEISYDL